MTAEPQRVSGHLAWPAIAGRLLSTRSMIVSTTRPDGRPHAVPTWFLWYPDGRIYFITARRTQKARNLAVEPWTVVHFGDGDDVLFAEGPVTVVSDQEEARAVDEQYGAKYIDPTSGTRASIFDNPQDDLYRLDATRIVSWMYGTVGGRTEWRLASGAISS